MWNLFYSRGNQTWSTTVVFGPRLWTGGAQSTRAARWRWWVLQTVQMTTPTLTFIIYFALLVCSFLVSLLPLSDDFPESTGVKRIVQALNANVWSSVEMKDGEMAPLKQLLLSLFTLHLCMYGMWQFTSLCQATIRALVWWVVWWPPDTTTLATAQIQSVTYFLQPFWLISILHVF